MTCIAGLPAADLLPEMLGGSTLPWKLLRQFYRLGVKMQGAVGKKPKPNCKSPNQTVLGDQNKLLLQKPQ